MIDWGTGSMGGCSTGPTSPRPTHMIWACGLFGMQHTKVLLALQGNMNGASGFDDTRGIIPNAKPWQKPGKEL